MRVTVPAEVDEHVFNGTDSGRDTVDVAVAAAAEVFNDRYV